MRIAIVNLTAGGLSGGYVKYLRELVPRLAAQEDVSDIALFLPEASARHAPSGFSAYTFRSGEAIGNSSPLKLEIARFAPDVVFVPTARWISVNAPVVSMVRNMEPLARPIRGNPPAEIVRNAGRAAAAFSACLKSDRVIAVSNYVRHFLTRRLFIPGRKIGVVPHGVTSPTSSRAPAGFGDSLSRERFVFTAGSIRPARGLEDLLDAFQGSDQLRSTLLAIAGGGGGDDARYRRAIDQRAAAGGVRTLWLGHLDEEEMAWCYLRCAAFAMTSRVEACPNTALEAMAAGAVIASGSHDPLPEFFANAALYYPVGQPALLSRALEAILAFGSAERARMSERALQRASQYTWEATAKATARELRLAIRTAKVDLSPQTK